MKLYKPLAWISLIVSIVLLFLPRIVPICTDLAGGMNPMRCHYTYQAEFLVGLLAVIISFSLFVLHTLEAKKLASFIISLLGIIVILLPQSWVIGICIHPASACHRTTAITICLGILLVLVGIIQVFLLSKQKTSQGEG
ncbi:DUF4418 family protein [Pectinatus frisingensis]|uniref:DUF4418 family protein n=1 Tax=Pectinatus frisingensis TaxID=865 RepID=UPI0018C6047A|nr:DUF4418 family protein [Pectinatus frisingensis]